MSTTPASTAISRSALVTLALTLAACPPSGAPVVTPPPMPPPTGYQPGAAVGAPCEVASQCASGVCEGQGCGADAPGVCVDASRACTMDLAPFCGCDGQTFTGSGSCPGRRFAAKGECAPAAAAKPDGAACLAATECASGVCEGQGCGPEAPGVCAPAQRGCTRDLRAYCGCDGQTFRASGSCPGQRFAAAEACPT
ncbi:MAG: hypothetical protein KBG48_31465 [Kofleriaceae bacterium]|jgi:hypothetical protein|nr:hypothetical protein [Kofleriaceae bacterium]MBP9171954.1 hypothetical protein [Kofleriaceae bacterium]MBP9862310.1 hypothetical protein [Kofleriaceae bacterium]